MIKIWFFWTPELAKNVLADLFNSNKFEIKFVVTSTDKPVWRWLELKPSPVKEFAIEKNIQLFQPEKIRNNEEFLSSIKNIEVDYYIVVAYGKILPEEILNYPKKLSVNVHGSILPKYRWASPIQSCLINWDSVTWVTIMQMSAWMDEWNIIDILEINIDKFETSWSLFEKFAQVSWNFLVDTLIKYDNWELTRIPQNSNEATYCKKINKEDWKADFNKSAKELFNLWQWLTPWPSLYTTFKDKKLTIEQCNYTENNVNWEIWEVIKLENWEIWIVCKNWVLILKTIKLEWKKSQEIKDFLNGYREFIWTVL